jgi:hypothetical protein
MSLIEENFNHSNIHRSEDIQSNENSMDLSDPKLKIQKKKKNTVTESQYRSNRDD